MALDSKMKVSIIIPVFNEEDNVGILHEKIVSIMERIGRDFEIIFVDDGSTDHTLERLKLICQKSPSTKVISFSRNYGQTAALSAGIDFSKGSILIPMDGDLQNDPEDILSLLQKIDEGYDVVSGWRKARKDPFFSRRLPSVLANKIISMIGKVPLHDYGCTLKAYKREILRNVRLYGEMHRFIPIYARWVGARVTEIPVRHHPRKAGSSKYGMMRIFKVILDLMVVKFLLSYSQKPIYVFGGMGLLMILGGFLSGVYAI
jgi:dolichol-phosphate mannosyltransferase